MDFDYTYYIKWAFSFAILRPLGPASGQRLLEATNCRSTHLNSGSTGTSLIKCSRVERLGWHVESGRIFSLLRSYFSTSRSWEKYGQSESIHSDRISFSPFFFFFFFFDGTGVWTQGFALAKQKLYHLNKTSIPFCSSYFGDVGGVSQTICLGWPWTMTLPISISQESRIIGISHCSPAQMLFLTRSRSGPAMKL
jgi:hypothetical protein